MLRVSLFISCFILLLPVNSKDQIYNCKPSSCGNIQNISYPFRLSGDPQHCGLSKYELSCDHNRTILQLDSGKYRVEEIDYVDFTLRVVDVGILKVDCSALPLQSLSPSNFSDEDPYRFAYDENVAITFISCPTPVNNSDVYIGNDCFSMSTYLYNYVVYGEHILASDLEDSCTIEIPRIWALEKGINNTSFRSIYDALVYGYRLYWDIHPYCNPSSCGNIRNISYPFQLSEDSHQNCRHNRTIKLSCDHNHTVLQLYSTKYRVEEIDYVNSKLRVVDVSLLTNNCSALPLLSFSPIDYKSNRFFHLDTDQNVAVTFITCATQANYSAIYMTNDCFFNSTLLNNYVVYGNLRESDLEDSCIAVMHFWALKSGINIDNNSLHSIYDGLLYGFHLNWDQSTLSKNYNGWIFDWGRIISFNIAMAVAACKLLLSQFVLAFLVYKWRRRHLSMYDNIEDFIQSHNNLSPVRYSYSDIKKMTKGFKHKLGQGGYGSVFKGVLQGGHLVAVKILNDSKSNGQDFINEVATIGRIHHFNVAPLIGFCAERSKRALVYNFMPNGSLEKYIFPREDDEDVVLSVEKLHAISLGIARGIEYLHRGCEMQILHFDIKPHNILLDENFKPKVSDFGLAKLYPTDDSIVNLTAVRGTMGYMAPELFYKNIGGVSYKSDVYSYGMLLMEMASKRKNSSTQAEHSSQQYFPSWVYDQFCAGKDLEMGDATEEERNIVKKMMIVAFWCIQWNPSDRPSMTKVLEMLEGNEQLLMPPKLYLSMQEVPGEDHGIKTHTASEFSTSFDDSSDTTSLIVNSS